MGKKPSGLSVPGPECFDTWSLSRALDALDTVRGTLADGEGFAPADVRTDLARLHVMAMDVVNRGWRSQAADMFDLADDIAGEIETMIERLEEIRDSLENLLALRPDDDTEID